MSFLRVDLNEFCLFTGDEAASFTKEEMQQGKHQEFEKKLQEHYLGVGSTKNGLVGLLYL
jgi:hypothetical protein